MMSVQRQNGCSYEIEGGEELLFSIWVKGYPSCAEKKIWKIKWKGSLSLEQKWTFQPVYDRNMYEQKLVLIFLHIYDLFKYGGE